MNKLDKLFSKVCTPNPKRFSEESEAKSVMKKNRFIFGVHLALISFQICSLPLSDLKSETNYMRYTTQLTMLGIFLIFCRSRPLIGRTLNAMLINIISLKIAHFHADGAYSALIMAYGIPCFVFYLTQSLSLTAISTIFQLIMATMTFKSNLIEAISFTDSHEFAEKFATKFIILSIPLQMLNLFVIYRLNQKTDELSRATKKAEEALEHQKMFVYSFSHEMRNPMNSLLGNLDLALMSQQIAPELREMIGTAKVCGVLLLNLINTVLDAGKLGLGKLEVNPVSTRVHEVFQRTWAISHDIISKKGLKSHLKISKQVPPRLLLDSHRLNQVLMNLLGNATKFTESGSIMLSVVWLSGASEVSEKCFLPVPYDDESEGVFEKDYNMYAIKRRGKGSDDLNQSLILAGAVKEFNLEGVSQPMHESKGILKIIIKDTGCGMNEEDLSKLFQKFSQVGQVTSKRQIGTGLGLFISKELVENMGGQIRVYSKPKIGTTFIVCIPTTALPMQPQSEQIISVSESLIPKLRSKKFTTIVADDSSFNVSLVCNFYSKIGVEVLTTASNGQLAFEKYIDIVHSRRRIDIVTLDIDMPIMDGKEVCQKIRQYEKENNLKRSIIILISGNYEEDDMRCLLNKGSKDNGPDCFLKKPLVFEELCWTLYKFGCISSNS